MCMCVCVSEVNIIHLELEEMEKEIKVGVFHCNLCNLTKVVMKNTIRFHFRFESMVCRIALFGQNSFIQSIIKSINHSDFYLHTHICIYVICTYTSIFSNTIRVFLSVQLPYCSSQFNCSRICCMCRCVGVYVYICVYMLASFRILPSKPFHHQNHRSF